MKIIVRRKNYYGGHENVLLRCLVAGSMLALWVHSCFCAKGTLPSGCLQPKPQHGEDTNVGLFQ